MIRYSLLLHQRQTEDIQSILDYWDCGEYQRRPLVACSHGMQKRVGLAVASHHDPSLLILDEPFSGLDIFHIKALESLVLNRKKIGRMTILSTHIIPYAAKLCDRAYLMERGNLLPVSKWHQADLPTRISLIESYYFES